MEMPKLDTNCTWESVQIKRLTQRQTQRGSCLEGNPRPAKDCASLIILVETADTNLVRALQIKSSLLETYLCTSVKNKVKTVIVQQK